nr:hypothetical protein [Candidatus Sigynarchaeota archaeon]
ITYNLLHYNVKECIHDEGTSNVASYNDCVNPLVFGYETWIVAAVVMFTVTIIMVSRKPRRV